MTDEKWIEKEKKLMEILRLRDDWDTDLDVSVSIVVKDAFEAGLKQGRREERQEWITKHKDALHRCGYNDGHQEAFDKAGNIVNEWLKKQKYCAGDLYKGWQQFSLADYKEIISMLKAEKEKV